MSLRTLNLCLRRAAPGAGIHRPLRAISAMDKSFVCNYIIRSVL